MRKLPVVSLMLGAAIFASSAASVLAAPTPIPGGANQVKAISGALGHTLFNGVIRLKLIEVRDATDAERTGMTFASDKKVMVMSMFIHNGVSANFLEILHYTLADKDEISFLITDNDVNPNPLDIQQGAAAKQKAIFIVDKTFTPVKLIVACPTCNAEIHFRDFRIDIPTRSDAH